MRDKALELSITEKEFWDMNIGEVLRQGQATANSKRLELKNQAIYDFTLANTIGKLVGIMLSGKGEAPKIEECYPNVFDKEEVAEANQRASIERFKAFAASYNSNFIKKGE